MRITILIENTSCRADLSAEHGLSLLVEAAGKRILFDTGASPAFADNAAQLGIDLSTVDMVVLSHGHYDHGGGISRFLELNAHAPVWVSPHAFEPHFNATGKDIGLPPSLKGHPRLCTAPAGAYAIAPGITLHPASSVPCPYPAAGEGMSTLIDGARHPDDFRHEQYLLIEEAGKRVLISGCSHRGILNIARHFAPDILIGGLHLAKADAGRIQETGKHLLSLPTRIYTGHCTGDAATTLLQQMLGDCLIPFATGDTISINMLP